MPAENCCKCPLQALIKRSGVPRPTVFRILRGNADSVGFGKVAKVAKVLGVGFGMAPVEPDVLRKREARRKARLLVTLTQGTMGLEGGRFPGAAQDPGRRDGGQAPRRKRQEAVELMVEFTPIPGETPIDPSGLINRSIRNRRELNEAEGKNIAEAVYKYLLGDLTTEMVPFDFSWALELHREMFGLVWQWAGKTRQIDLNLGIGWQQVEPQLYSLFQNLPYWKDTDLIEQAARLHHGAVSIHPFENGNGRWSRMLANIWLKRNGLSPTVWPEQAVGETSVIREEYLAAVRAADKFDYAPLIALHRKYTPEESPEADEETRQRKRSRVERQSKQRF